MVQVPGTRGTVEAPTLHVYSTSHTAQTNFKHVCPWLPLAYSEGSWPAAAKLLASSPLLLSISLSSISSPCSCCCRSWRRWSFSSASFCCWYSRCCFRHLILLFWNHTLTYNKRHIRTIIHQIRKFSSIDASAEYWKYSGRSRYQTKNCGRESSKGQLN